MKHFSFLRGFTAATLFLTAFSLNAQLSSVGYFMDGASNRYLSNPALTPDNSYLSFPLIGQLGVKVQSNMGLANFLYPNPKGNDFLTFMHPDISADDFLSKLKKDNCFNAGINEQIIGFGIKRGKSFFDFDIALRTDVNGNIPKELFAFFKKGMSDGGGQVYDIRHLHLSAMAYSEFSLGYSRDIMKNLSVGARAKFLVGMAGANANVDQLKITMAPDYWQIQPKISGELYVNSASMTYNEKGYISGLEFSDDYRSFLRPSGYGMAFDLGASYTFHSLHLSASINDLGTIRWNKVLGATVEKEIEYGGFSNVTIDGTTSISDQIDGLTESLEEFLDLSTISENIHPDVSSSLNTKIHLAAEYDFLNRMLSAGVLYTHHHTGFGGFNECMLVGNFRLKKILQLSAGYSFLTDFNRSLGVALSLFNTIYVSWDNIPMHLTPQYIPIDALNSTVRVGINIPLGGNHSKTASES